MRAVRPNSVIATTTVSFQRGPSSLSNAANAPSRPPSNCARRPVAPPSLAWVSQPSKASAPMRGPSSAAISRAAPSAALRINERDVAAGLERLHALLGRHAVGVESGLQRARRARDRRGRRGPSAARRDRRSAAADRRAPSRGSARRRAPPAAPSRRPRARPALRPDRLEASAATARLSQPLSTWPGAGMPLSRTSWPSKCERSR